MESGTFFQPDGRALTYGGELGGPEKANLLANNNVAQEWPTAEYYASIGQFPGFNAGLFLPSRGPKLRPDGAAVKTDVSVPSSIADRSRARYAVKWSNK